MESAEGEILSGLSHRPGTRTYVYIAFPSDDTRSRREEARTTGKGKGTKLREGALSPSLLWTRGACIYQDP